MADAGSPGVERALESLVQARGLLGSRRPLDVGAANREGLYVDGRIPALVSLDQRDLSSRTPLGRLVRSGWRFLQRSGIAAGNGGVNAESAPADLRDDIYFRFAGAEVSEG